MTDLRAFRPAGPAAAEGVLGAVRTLLTDVSCVKRQLARGLAGTLSPGALTVLSILVRHGSQRVSDVAERMHLDTSVISRHVRALEVQGLIDRQRVASDHRAYELIVTDAGRRAFAAVAGEVVDRLGRALADWTPADVATLQSLLDRLHVSLAPFGASASPTDHPRTTTYESELS